MKSKNVFEQNEITGNRAAANVMGITECALVVIYIMNVLGIFIVNEQAMNMAFFSSTIVLMMPMVLNHFVDNSNPKLKYVYVIDAALFILFTSSTLSYHVIIIYAYPILISCLYFSRNLTMFATVLAPCVVTIGQLICFKYQFVRDHNFDELSELLQFSILPKCLVLVALAMILRLTSNRSAEMLATQQTAMQKVLKHQQDMITGFALLAESRDETSGKHAERVSLYAGELARAMKQRGLYPKVLTDDYIEALVSATKLHDIGRINVSDTILQKAGKLTEEEFDVVRQHTTKGAELLSQALRSDDDEYQKMAYETALYHHERWNGRGYPEGLRETMIPLSARIVAVCDVFEAISTKRCYREAMPLDKCFDIIKRGSGVDFDPMIVDIFLAIQDKIIEVHEKDLNEKYA